MASQVPMLSRIIRNRRETLGFSSAREFWRRLSDDINVSYSHYAAVENGHRFPEITLALAIGKHLEIRPRDLCHLWAKAQMPDGLTSGYFDLIALDDDGTLPLNDWDLPNFVTLSKRNLPFLMKYPVAWEIATWVISMAQYEPHTYGDIHKVFPIPKAQLDAILTELKRLKIVRSDGKLHYRNVGLVALSSDPEMLAFRDIHYGRVSESFLSSNIKSQIDGRTSYRRIVSRSFSKAQSKEIVKRLSQLFGEISEFPPGGPDHLYLQLGLWNKA